MNNAFRLHQELFRNPVQRIGPRCAFRRYQVAFPDSLRLLNPTFSPSFFA